MKQGGGGNRGNQSDRYEQGRGVRKEKNARTLWVHVNLHSCTHSPVTSAQSSDRREDKKTDDREKNSVFLSGGVSVYVWQHKKNKNQGQAVDNLFTTEPRACVNVRTQHLRFYLAYEPI